MPSRRTRHRLTLGPLEALEPRWTLSALPPNMISVVQGNVPAPGAVSEVSVPIPGADLARHRHATLFALSTSPNPGSALDPHVAIARGPDGQALPLRRGAPFRAGRHGSETAYFKDQLPGSVGVGVTGLNRTTGPFTVQTTLPGDVNGDHQVSLNDLKGFTSAFTSTLNDAFYKPSADANLNGFVGHGDAKILERNLTPLTPKIPLRVKVSLEPDEQVKHAPYHNSGGITRDANITIIGRTTPGSIVFADGGLGNYSFDGAALPTDAQGNFQFKATLRDALTNFEFLVIDPWRQQKVAALPIIYLPRVFSAP